MSGVGCTRARPSVNSLEFIHVSPYSRVSIANRKLDKLLVSVLLASLTSCPLFFLLSSLSCPRRPPTHPLRGSERKVSFFPGQHGALECSQFKECSLWPQLTPSSWWISPTYTLSWTWTMLTMRLLFYTCVLCWSTLCILQARHQSFDRCCYLEWLSQCIIHLLSRLFMSTFCIDCA